MTELWMGLALLILTLVFVLLWPALRGAGADSAATAGSKRDVLANLYREQQAELKAARESGALDDSQYAELEAEMARNLLAAEASGETDAPARRGRGLLLAVALLLPLVALGLYFGTGHYDDLALYRDIAASRQGATDAATETRITRALKKHSENHPDDLTSRYALAQRLMVSGDMQGAVDAYRYVAEREPEAAGVRAELAQAMFFARGSKMDAEISGLVDRVLQTQPDNGTALGLAGIAAFEGGEHRAARDYWQRALDQLSPGSAAAQALEAGVARAEKALADAGEPVEPAAAKSEQPAAGPAITVRVTLAGGVDAEPDTPVFIYARGTDGPMPLAIVRLSAGQLPAEVVLDESRAMMPNRSIAGVDEVQLVARLAVHGDARPAPGDWQGEIDSLPKSEWDQPQRIAIDRKL